MEIHARKPRLAATYDLENANGFKNKKIAALPSKKHGLSVRGALGELQSNVQQIQVNSGKAAVEFEKKSLKCGVRSNYNHVQSKIDTGLCTKSSVQITSKLRREESTAGLAARAIARTRAALKDTQLAKIYEKENASILVQTKKCLPKKEIIKQPPSKETKELKNPSKPIIKEPTESLGKLKLVEKNSTDLSTKLVEGNYEIEPFYDGPPLPEDIEDIDSNDGDNLLLMTEYIKDIYNYLTDLETKYSVKYDHLKNQNSITGHMRATLIDWMMDVHHQFSLLLETFHLAVGIVDRYLQAVPNIQRNKLQLVGVSALYIASKYEEIYAPDVGDFVYVTDNAYNKLELFQCERDIMLKLEFCLARPIPLSFLRRYIKAANGTTKNHQLAKYFVDLSLVEYTMCHYRPSELAAAALCLSLHLFLSKQIEEVWTPTLIYYSNYSISHIMPIIKKIAKIVVNVDKVRHKSVINKYSDVKLGKVASLHFLKSKAICDLAK